MIYSLAHKIQSSYNLVSYEAAARARLVTILNKAEDRSIINAVGGAEGLRALLTGIHNPSYLIIPGLNNSRMLC